MKILLITQWFDPEPTFKGQLFAKALSERGHQVEVLTGFPNYPGGKIYPGYKLKLFQRECIDGIGINRVWLYPNHDRSALKRILNYASFAMTSTLLGIPLTLLRMGRPDVIYVYHPPATVSLAPLFFRIFFGVPFVYDIQDLWPDTLQATGMVNSKLILSLVAQWCQWTYRMASQIIVLSPGFKKKLKERGVDDGKISTIYNWADERHIQHQPTPDLALAKKLGLEGKFNVVFAGTMGKAQALDSVVEAAQILQSSHHDSPLSKPVQIVFIGGGIEREHLKERCAKLALSNVLFLERLPMSEIGNVLNLADVLLVHLKNDPLFKITIPSKTQAYLASQKPVLMAVSGDSADLIQLACAGITTPPESPQALAEAILKLSKMTKTELEQLGKNGKTYYQDHLSLAVGTRKIEAQLVKASRSRWFQPFFQRFFDLLFAVPLFILTLPILLACWVTIRIRLGKGALFRQPRAGLDGKTFVIYKWRTMTDARSKTGELLPDSERLTPLGLFLRKWSLDELPQILNVIRGDLSLVGPRPLLIQYVQRYNPRQKMRLEVKPGITGWAQINGRNTLSWPERFELDCWYVENRSVGLYFKILALTFLKTLRHENVAASTTMPEFLGEQNKKESTP